MKTLTEKGILKHAQRFVDSIDHALYELDGEEKEIGIFKKQVEGKDTIKIYVFFDDGIVGDVGNVKLVDSDGDIVAESIKHYVKPSEKGLYIAFKYTYIEEEV